MIHPRGREVLSEIERAFSPASEYNSWLFSLYLIYMRRYQIDYSHIPHARRLAALLQEKPWPPFTSWQQLIECSRRLKFNPKPRSSLGCPILKIGYILQEIGAVGAKADEQGHWIHRLLLGFEPKTQEVLSSFIENMKQLRRANGTLRLYLYSLTHLQRWIQAHSPGLSLLAVNREGIDDHLHDFFATHGKTRYRYNHSKNLTRFYDWCLQRKLVLANPCAHLHLGTPTPRITVCSEEQIHRLRQFLQNPRSDPTHALIISLALFFGLTQADLLFATLQPDSHPLCIVLERKPKTFHRQSYNREQLLQLPKNPRWFLLLQLRFLAEWKNLHEKTVRTFPRPSLILPRHGYYNRPISRGWIQRHIHQATIAATGSPIPLSVLRKTCGHLLSQNGDASTLSRLGWSRKHSFDYTWMPRQFYLRRSRRTKSP